jgi:hypothetical protein
MRFSDSAARAAISASAFAVARSRSAWISALASATIFCASARASASALIVGGFGLLRLELELFGRGDVVRDRARAFGQHAADARQGEARQDQVDRHEGDEQPEDLVREGREVELRKTRRRCAAPVVSVAIVVPPRSFKE